MDVTGDSVKGGGLRIEVLLPLLLLLPPDCDEKETAEMGLEGGRGRGVISNSLPLSPENQYNEMGITVETLSNKPS